MSDDSTTTIKETKQPEEKKYVILRNTPHWEIENEAGETEMILSITKPDTPKFTKFHKNIKKEVKDKIFKAVRLGALDFTDDPATYVNPSRMPARGVQPRPRYKTNEFQRDAVKQGTQIPRAPQISNGTMRVDDVHPEAEKLMRLQNTTFPQKLAEVIAQMKVDEAAVLLRDLFRMESSGMNPTMSSRASAIEAIEGFMFKLKITPGQVTPVKSQADPESKDSVTRLGY